MMQHLATNSQTISDARRHHDIVGSKIFTGSRVSNPKKICQIWPLPSRYWLIWWDAVVLEELENSPLVLTWKFSGAEACGGQSKFGCVASCMEVPREPFLQHGERKFLT